MKFQVLRERANVIASFPEHPVYRNFEMFSVLILGFLFWFDFPEHPLYGNFGMFSVLILRYLFWFAVTYQRACGEVIFFCNFRCSAKEKKILLLSLSTLHIAISKCIVSLFYFFNFDFPLFTQNASRKVIYSWNFRCSSKEIEILLLSWSTLYIAVWKFIVS